jgi:hypothetical protein
MTVWVIVIVFNSGHVDRREFIGELSMFLASLDEEDIRQFSAEPKRVEPEKQLKLPMNLSFGEDEGD